MAEELEWNQKYFLFEAIEEFPKDEQNLIQEAINASKMSYAPYSKFHVGAAVLLADGTIIKGANQENASYPEGSCAERVAFFKAATTGKRQTIIKAAVIAMKAGKLVAATPCGGCRQVMLETEEVQKKPVQFIMMAGESRWVKINNIKSLLPFSFNL